MQDSVMAKKHKTFDASKQVSCRERFASQSEKTETNAADSAPSPKRSLRRFGILKATTKASQAYPAPNSPAKICSLTSPRTLLNSTATDTSAADLAIVSDDFTEWLTGQKYRVQIEEQNVLCCVIEHNQLETNMPVNPVIVENPKIEFGENFIKSLCIVYEA